MECIAMITAETLRYRDPLDLLRALGYDAQPIAIVPDDWRHAGIEVDWNHSTTLAARLPRLDLYLVRGAIKDDGALRFLRSLAHYNVVVKSVLFAHGDDTLAIYDLSPRRELRRLSVDLCNPSAHAIDRLNLLTSGSDPARLFDRALDREMLTRQFFDRFRTAVRDVANALRAQLPNESSDAIDSHALLLLSRLLFLYFVQQKGWLNGERRFLIDRLDEALRDEREFFATILLPLFFGCLNTPASERTPAAKRFGAIPYLNGGLFEPAAFERKHSGIRLENELMQRVIEEVFERFAFSIDESDAAGTHIDPEMLGKVFESLMAEDERAASGSFYTPRAIVDVLTSRAIEEWIADDDPLRALQRLETITVLDPACGSGAFLLSALRVIERLTHSLAARAGIEIASNVRQRIVERSLYGVDLKPEAVRLCELRLWLAIVAQSDAPIERVQPLPNLDRNILQGNSLLTPTDFLGDGRMDVYRDWILALRTQQDLIARYRSATQSERPALARMIRAHDCSLAEEMLHRAIAVDERELEQLAMPQRDLFGRMIAMDAARCSELQERVRDHRRLLDRVEREELAFFSYDIHFAPVMARGGFDIVVGNPPWVRNGRIDARTKRMLADRYRWFRGDASERAAFHQPDLSLAFFERALALANDEGVVSLLVPAKLLNSGYAAEMRRSAQTSLSIVALDDWSDDARRHFEADTFPLGVTVRRCHSERSEESPSNGGGSLAVSAASDDRRPLTRPSATLSRRERALKVNPDQDLQGLLPAGEGARSADEGELPHVISIGGDASSRDRARNDTVRITSAGESFVIPQSQLTLVGSEWSLVPHDIGAIVAGLREEHLPLSEILRRAPVMGVKSGANAAFFLDVASTRGETLITTDGLRVPLDAACRCIRGRDVKRWSAGDGAWMLWPPPGGWRKPPRWLQRFAEARAIPVNDLRLSYVRPEHAGIKVVWKDLSRGLCAAVAGETLIPNQTLYVLDAATTEEAHVLAALFNSTIVNCLTICVAERAKDFHYRYFGRTMARIPLPLVQAGSEAWTRLARCARRGRDGFEVMSEVDATVSELYGVTPAEHSRIAAFVARRLGHLVDD
jgi:hypothetical protein